jgi:hypothetical protein
MIEFPKHEAGLWLMHNDHKSVYRTVQQAINMEDHGYTLGCWVSPEQRQKAIDTNECWTLQWYPQTPNGSCILSAADLDVLLTAAMLTEKGVI